ncbi:nucleotidyltransferase domain-containing protein [Azoarcus sp. DN11]|nr:nucleotidyltransferase domain-containing protein [Azoarcus sp. DN11]
MRIPADKAHIASDIVASQYGKDARIWLFGSRADDGQRGGDVDLTWKPIRTMSCGSFAAGQLSPSCST